MISLGKSDRALDFYKEIKDSIPKEIIDSDKYVFTVGGDGQLLRAIREYGYKDKIFIPLFAGSLGFLSNKFTVGEGRNFDNIEDDLIIEEANLVSAFFNADEKHVALNDIYVERSSRQSAKLTIWITNPKTGWKQKLANRMTCDGVIVSTPFGSTGYNYSAQGPVSHWGLPILTVSAICPHQKGFRSVVIPREFAISIRVIDSQYRPVVGVVDGMEGPSVVSVDFKEDKEARAKIGYFEKNIALQRLVAGAEYGKR